MEYCESMFFFRWSRVLLEIKDTSSVSNHLQLNTHRKKFLFWTQSSRCLGLKKNRQYKNPENWRDESNEKIMCPCAALTPPSVFTQRGPLLNPQHTHTHGARGEGSSQETHNSPPPPKLESSAPPPGGWLQCDMQQHGPN